MQNVEGAFGLTIDKSVWSKRLQTWLGFLIITGFLLFGITGRIQFSCNPMITGGDLPSFCSSGEIVANVNNRPTHGDSINKLAADPNQDSNTLQKISEIQEPVIEDNPQVRTYALAKNPNTPENVLLKLVGSDDLEVLAALLSNKSATSNSKVMEKLCSNPLVKQKFESCNSPLPTSCRKNHARNLVVGIGIGVLTFLAAPILLPAEAIVAPFAVGAIGGALASGTSAGLLELFTKC